MLLRRIGLSLLVGAMAMPLMAQNKQALKETYAQSYSRLVYLNYVDAYNKALDMKDAIDGFLNNPNPGTLAIAQQSWLMARVPYGQSEAFRFYEGPIDFVDAKTGQEGPEGRLNSWPLDEAYIDYVKGQPQAGLVQNLNLPLNKEALLKSNQANDEADVSLGYHAIEFLLWGQDLDPMGPGHRPASDYLAGKPSNDRRRAYLRLATDILIDDLKFLVDEWDPRRVDNYAAKFAKLAPQQVIGSVLTSLATLSGFELSSERMAVPLDSGDPEDEHSCFSDNTHNDFLMNGLGLANVYYGTYGTYQGQGLQAIVAAHDPKLNRSIEQELQKSLQLLAAIPAPIDRRVLSSFEGSSERRSMEQAIQSLLKLADLFQKAGVVLGSQVEVRSE